MSEPKPWYVSWGIPLVGSFAGIGAILTWILNLKLLMITQGVFGSILLACEGTAFAAHFELSFPQFLDAVFDHKCRYFFVKIIFFLNYLLNIHNKMTTLHQSMGGISR